MVDHPEMFNYLAVFHDVAEAVVFIQKIPIINDQVYTGCSIFIYFRK